MHLAAAVAIMAYHRIVAVPQVVFRFALQLGMTPLTGTSNPTHMREDLESFDFAHTSEDMETVEQVSG